MLSNFSVRIFVCYWLVGIMNSQNAKADLFSDLEVHGFATQGFVKTDANKFFGDSAQGSFDFFELGVNATVQPTSDIRFAAQLLSRRAGSLSSGSPKIDFALADFSVSSSPAAKLNILAGRVKNPLGLFNDTRDVAFTRPGIFLPQTVYFQSLRSLALSADGVALRANVFSEHGNFEVQAGIGKPIVDENVEFAYLGGGFEGDYEEEGLSWVGRMLYETPNERWRLAISAAKTSLEFEPADIDPLGQGKTEILYTIVSGQYTLDRWSISAEYVFHPTQYRGFAGSAYRYSDLVMEGYYLQLNWFARNDMTFMMRFEEGFVDRSDRYGEAFEAATGIPAHTRYARAFVGGVRWDINPNLMLRAEYQSSNGTFILSRRENPNPFATDPDWNMLSLSLSYRF